MRAAKSYNRKGNYDELRALEQQLADLNEEKEEEIISVLNWFQKIKYRRYLKSELEQE